MLTLLFHEIKYEGTSSNKIIAANREEEKYKHAQKHDSGLIELIAAGENVNWGRREE